MSEQTRWEALLLRYEELRAEDAPVLLEELWQDCPELVGELKRQIQDLESMNALLGSAASADAAAETLTPDAAHPGPSDAHSSEPLCTGSRYQLLRFHAKGGLGEVLVARDEEL